MLYSRMRNMFLGFGITLMTISGCANHQPLAMHPIPTSANGVTVCLRYADTVDAETQHFLSNELQAFIDDRQRVSTLLPMPVHGCNSSSKEQLTLTVNRTKLLEGIDQAKWVGLTVAASAAASVATGWPVPIILLGANETNVSIQLSDRWVDHAPVVERSFHSFPYFGGKSIQYRRHGKEFRAFLGDLVEELEAGTKVDNRSGKIPDA